MSAKSPAKNARRAGHPLLWVVKGWASPRCESDGWEMQRTHGAPYCIGKELLADSILIPKIMIGVKRIASAIRRIWSYSFHTVERISRRLFPRVEMFQSGYNRGNILISRLQYPCET